MCLYLPLLSTELCTRNVWSTSAVDGDVAYVYCSTNMTTLQYCCWHVCGTLAALSLRLYTKRATYRSALTTFCSIQYTEVLQPLLRALMTQRIERAL